MTFRKLTGSVAFRRELRCRRWRRKRWWCTDQGVLSPGGQSPQRRDRQVPEEDRRQLTVAVLAAGISAKAVRGASIRDEPGRG